MHGQQAPSWPHPTADTMQSSDFLPVLPLHLLQNLSPSPLVAQCLCHYPNHLYTLQAEDKDAFSFNYSPFQIKSLFSSWPHPTPWELVGPGLQSQLCR